MEGSAPRGAHYCQNCGQALQDDSRFCQYCGAQVTWPQSVTPLPPPSPVYYYQNVETSWQKAKRLVATVAAWMTLFLLVEGAVNICILIWGASIVFPQTPDHTYPIVVVVPWIVTIVRIGGWALAGFYVFLVSAITVSYIFMLRRSKGLADELRGVMPKDGHSPIFTVCTLMFAAIFFNVTMYLVAWLLGYSANTPSFDEDLWALLLSMAGASVWEEIICRVLYIGIPLLLLHLATKQFKDPKRYFIGGNFELGKWEVTFLIFSSAMFAMAHIFNWDAFKVLPTFVSGLALGYLFLRFGIYASIMMHFFVDFLTIPIETFGGDGLTITMGLFTYIMIAIGFACFIFYSGKVIKYLTGKEIALEKKVVPSYYPVAVSSMPSPEQRPPTSAPLPTQTGGPAFICRYCGGIEARYEDGGLVCTRCGKRN